MSEVISMYREFPVDCSFTYAVKGKALNGSVVDRIMYHEPRGEGDQHYCDIYYVNGSLERIFRPDSIGLTAPPKEAL
jgi:hypothetical protein